MVSDITLAASIFVSLGLCLAGIPYIMRPFRASNSSLRNLTHALSFLLLAGGVHFIQEKGIALAAGMFAVVFLIAAIELDWLPALMEGTRKRDYGLVGSALGFVITVALFYQQKNIVIFSLLTVGLADPLASAVGRNFGTHTITSWGATRTLEGSTAFALMTAALAFVFIQINTPATLSAIGLSVFIGSSAAAVELITPSAIDNAAIALWSGFLFYSAMHQNAALLIRWPTAILLAGFCAWLMHRFKWVDPPATIVSAFIAAIAWAFGGLQWLLPIGVFFITSSLLTHYKQAVPSERKPRDILQAMVNGALPILPIAGFAINGRPIWYFLYVGSVATANADTWSTEIGRFAKKLPRSLKTFRIVDRGTSGAVSYLGTFASILGGILIGITAAVVGPSPWRFPLVVTGACVGPIGSFIDSMVGAWIQGKFQCSVCQRICETPSHCGKPTYHVSGFKWMNNSLVNAIVNVAGMLLAFKIYQMIG